ncbi:Zn(II)2Cys6 transcription factor ASCRUDRAFT_26859, partial [Ascoidea rubescens DSM 1968]
KHVSRACIQCRGRHLRCDGILPICGRCLKNDKTCTYVPSHRGGSRKKIKSNTAHTFNHLNRPFPLLAPSSLNFSLNSSLNSLNSFNDCSACDNCNSCSEDESSSYTNSNSNSYNSYRMKRKLFKKTKNSNLLNNLSFPISISHSNSFINNNIKNNNNNSNNNPFNNNNNNNNNQNFIHSKSNLIDTSKINTASTILLYYSTFHNFHPFLPPINEINDYITKITNSDDLVSAMKLIIDGQTTNQFSNDIRKVSDRITQCLMIIENDLNNDLVSLQALILLSIASYISSLHDLNKYIREKCFSLIKFLNINVIDEEYFKSPIASPTLNSNDSCSSKAIIENLQNLQVFKSKRLQNIPTNTILDSSRRLFWEFYMIDITINSLDGKTLSKLPSLSLKIKYPTYPPRETFDYKSRSEASTLLNDVIRMNRAILEKQPYDSYLVQASVALGNWEMKIEDPSLFNTPYLINSLGQVNEGVHQAIIMFNYAKMFIHKPFSFLSLDEIPVLPKSPNSNNNNLKNNDLSSFPNKIDSRKIIETRKTIEAANSVVKLLIDTNPAQIHKRTPLFACSVAYAGIVHLGAYVWTGSSIDQSNINPSFSNHFPKINPGELQLYKEYLKLELNGIYSVSRHWHLPGELASHLRNSIFKLVPELYHQLEDSFPRMFNITNEKQSLINKFNASPVRAASTISNNSDFDFTSFQNENSFNNNTNNNTPDNNSNIQNNNMNNMSNMSNMSDISNM